MDGYISFRIRCPIKGQCLEQLSNQQSNKKGKKKQGAHAVGDMANQKLHNNFKNASKKIVAHSIAASACCSSFKCHLAKNTSLVQMGGGGGGASFVQTLAFDGEQPLQSSHATAASCHRAARGGVGGCHWHETVQFHPEQTRRAAHSGTSMQHEKSTKVLAHPVH